VEIIPDLVSVRCFGIVNVVVADSRRFETDLFPTRFQEDDQFFHVCRGLCHDMKALPEPTD